MATMAEMMAQSGLQSSQQAPDITGAIKSGAELAQHVQQIQTARAQIEQQKQELQMNKIGKVAALYEVAGKSEGKHQKFMYEQAIPNTIKALGLDDYFPESTQAFFQSMPDAMSFIKAKLNEGGDEAKGYLGKVLEAAQDPTGEKLGLLIPEIQKFGALDKIAEQVRDGGGDLLKSQQFGLEAARKREQAQFMADAAKGRQDSSQNFTATQADKDKAKDISHQFISQAIPSAEAALSIVDKSVIPGGIAGYDFDKAPQIEGIGGKDSLLPPGRLTKRGRANRQAAVSLGNVLIKNATGAGMGDAEAVRLLNEMGLDRAIGEGGGFKVIFTGTKSSADFARGVKNFQERIEASKNTIFAGAGPNATQYFKENRKALESAVDKPIPAGQKVAEGVARSNEAPKKSWRDYDETSQQTLINNWMKSTGKSREEVIKMLDQRARGEL